MIANIASYLFNKKIKRFFMDMNFFTICTMFFVIEQEKIQRKLVKTEIFSKFEFIKANTCSFLSLKISGLSCVRVFFINHHGNLTF